MRFRNGLGCVLVATLAWPLHVATAVEDPAAYVKFSEEPTGTCVTRSGVQILVSNTHPRRTVKVWLDRYVAGVGTGDRSRTELAAGAEPEPLGCSRNANAPQEWRLVRAIFVD